MPRSENALGPLRDTDLAVEAQSLGACAGVGHHQRRDDSHHAHDDAELTVGHVGREHQVGADAGEGRTIADAVERRVVERPEPRHHRAIPGHLTIDRVHDAAQQEKESSQPDGAHPEEDRRGEHQRCTNCGDGVGTDPVRDQPVDQRPEDGEKRPLERPKRLHPSRPAARDPISVSLFTFGTGPRITAGTGTGKWDRGLFRVQAHPGRSTRKGRPLARPYRQDRVGGSTTIQRLTESRLAREPVEVRWNPGELGWDVPAGSRSGAGGRWPGHHRPLDR